MDAGMQIGMGVESPEGDSEPIFNCQTGRRRPAKQTEARGNSGLPHKLQAQETFIPS
jgi:hypothetical protein